MRMRSIPTWRKLAATMAVLLLVLTACGGDDEGTEATIAAPETTAAAAVDGDDAGFFETSEELDAPAGGEAPDGARSDPLGSGGVDAALLQTRSLGRDIIFTANMTVAVVDVAAASAEATRIIEELGGFLFGQETTGEPEPVSRLTFKVLPGDFQQALARLGSVGDIRTQTVTADDVTERVVDLESRISTAESSVERLKGFLEEATDIETIAELEAQLLQRETDLETMRGQLRTLQDRVDLATIYLTLTEALSAPDLHLEVTGFPGHDDGISCPADGRIQVEEGEKATVCFEITNTGDSPLAGFTLRDAVLDVELADLIVVWGDPNGILEPGQTLVLAHEMTVERNQRTQTRVSAEPVNEEGNRVEGREVASTVSMGIDAVDPGGLPGFTDGLEASWDAVLTIGGLIVLFAGALLPFIWVIPLLWLLWRWRKRHVAAQAARVQAAPKEPPPAGVEPADEPADKPADKPAPTEEAGDSIVDEEEDPAG
ncbi:MAG: DUF4349 domain-containing protein [Acidimicrobiia bacterium]|nr:DUF4349 domain-containing protein [Acidimicrobiia bacterium]